MATRRFLGPLFPALVWALAVPVLALAEPVYEQGLLWRIQGGDIGADYVFGTIHIEDPRVLDLADPIEDAFTGADTFVMELEPDVASIAQLSTAMVYTDGRTLEQVIGEELFARAAEALAERGIPEPVARHLKPWAVLMRLNAPRPETGMVMDMVLYTKAVQQGKKTGGLETAEEQISVLADLPLEMQISLIKESLDNQALMEKIHERLVNAYMTRDLGDMLALNEQAMAQTDPATRKLVDARLVTDRNQRMVERMLPALREGAAFVAVGALHLPGTEGILRLLEERGYTVTKVY